MDRRTEWRTRIYRWENWFSLTIPDFLVEVNLRTHSLTLRMHLHLQQRRYIKLFITWKTTYVQIHMNLYIGNYLSKFLNETEYPLLEANSRKHLWRQKNRINKTIKVHTGIATEEWSTRLNRWKCKNRGYSIFTTAYKIIASPMFEWLNVIRRKIRYVGTPSWL